MPAGPCGARWSECSRSSPGGHGGGSRLRSRARSSAVAGWYITGYTAACRRGKPMPPTMMDKLFVAMAAIEMIAVGALIYAALKLLETAKKGQQRVQPAVNEAKAVAALGKAI